MEQVLVVLIVVFLVFSGIGSMATENSSAAEEYEFLIITPEMFSLALQPLVEHKEQYGVPTKIVTLPEIYENAYFSIEGRDEAEKIKYFIKTAIENWEICYVMLVGGKEEVPVRYVDICSWGEHRSCISDLYYADIYNTTGGFCSWDSNNDNVFAGQSMNGMVDDVDLCPDIAIGRILCKTQTDVDNIVEKVITYETTAYNKDWFHNLILCGGDCADIGWHEKDIPQYFGRTGGIVWEGEYIGDMVADLMSGFNAKKIYATGLLGLRSKFLTVRNINTAINEGTGFILFVGHGNPSMAMVTNFPLCKRIWLPYPQGYFISDSEGLTNGEKLPVAIFAGCDCGDFDTISNPIAWELVRKKNGGAIASFAATTGSLIIFSSLCTETYTPLLILNTFKFFAEGMTTIGDLWSSIIQTYLADEDAWSLGDDFSELNWRNNLANILVLEEWTLFGDPTLRIGGYP